MESANKESQLIIPEVAMTTNQKRALIGVMLLFLVIFVYIASISAGIKVKRPRRRKK